MKKLVDFTSKYYDIRNISSRIFLSRTGLDGWIREGVYIIIRKV